MLKHPSNFEMFVEACGKEAFQAAMSITFDETTTAVGWRIYEAPDRSGEYLTTAELEKKRKHKWLALTWHLNDGQSTPLPFAMAACTACEFAWNWLQKNSRPADPEPDNDGSVEPHAFRMEAYSEGWCYDIVRIRPAWAIYGK